ncbi:MAG: hypothetical protein R2712_06635 [Vicinamibacterales bacterium]
MTRGLFPGAGKDGYAMSDDRLAERYGVERLHRLLGRIDPPSAARILPRDRSLHRPGAGSVFPGRAAAPRTSPAVSPLGPDVEVIAIGLRLPADALAARLSHRVDRQFELGLWTRFRANLAAGVPATARPFGEAGLPAGAGNISPASATEWPRVHSLRRRIAGTRAPPVDLVPQRA